MQRALREFIRYAGAPALVAGALGILVPSSPFFGVLAIAVLIALFAMRPILGWSLVVLSYPFIYLQLFIGKEINIPYVDLFAMLTFVGIVCRWFVLRVRNDRTGHSSFVIRHSSFPGLLPFLLFILAATLSLTNVEHLALGVKYLLRPLTFFYLMFIVLPMVVMDTPRRLFTTFRLLFVVGIAVAAMGVWSLVFPPEPGVFRRAVPIAIFGTTPLGTNHNLIAEVLVSVIPIGIILAAFAHERFRRWYVVGTVALSLVTLLTFSRNGWLTLAVEGLVLLVAIARDRGMSWRRIMAFGTPAIAIALLAVGVFSTSTIARSSNINRIRLTEIALQQFREHPIVGAGVGTFIEAVNRDRWYVADFGQPQEAHGLIQKLLAETGALGLMTFAVLLASIIGYIVRVYRTSAIAEHWRLILLALGCSAFGSIVFQLFNTSYFVSKLWLPLGLALAAARLAERGIALRVAEGRHT
ncbi:O-antigen ligase family protein [Candidatus Uhrbacteria bacterium]|nr:O-antigen ligase family protein [Candidatus Uhrbacteria bacterium]